MEMIVQEGELSRDPKHMERKEGKFFPGAKCVEYVRSWRKYNTLYECCKVKHMFVTLCDFFKDFKVLNRTIEVNWKS